MKNTIGVKRQKVAYVVEISKSFDKEEHEHILSPLMPKIPEPSLDKASFPPPTLSEEEESIEFPFTEDERLEEMPIRHNISIDLNKSASEEDPWEDRDETEKNSKGKKHGKKIKVINHLKKHNKQLKKKNSRLHKRMTKLVKKHNNLCDFSEKLMKKNGKLYWTTRVLKTKWI
jgi:hypothetical protein